MELLTTVSYRSSLTEKYMVRLTSPTMLEDGRERKEETICLCISSKLPTCSPGSSEDVTEAGVCRPADVGKPPVLSALPPAGVPSPAGPGVASPAGVASPGVGTSGAGAPGVADACQAGV